MEKPKIIKTAEELQRELEQKNAELAAKDAKMRQLEEQVVKLKNDAMHDQLTGLKSRKYFEEKTTEDLSAIVSGGKIDQREEGFKSGSLLFCDVDKFKEVNDKFGHEAGDEILIGVARILEANVRETDTVCRWAGDEIAISLLGANEQEAAEKAESIRGAVKELISAKYAGEQSKYPGLDVSLSIGVVPFELGISFKEMVKRGDEAMYASKKLGRDRITKYSEIKSASETK